MFPGNGQTSLTTAWLGITNTASRIKSDAANIVAASQVSRKAILDYAHSLADGLAALAMYAAVPGLPEYAQVQLNNLIDIVAEYNAMTVQIVATQDWIVANFPKDVSGNLVVYSFDVNKRYKDIYWDAGELAAIKTQLNLLTATIN